MPLTCFKCEITSDYPMIFEDTDIDGHWEHTNKCEYNEYICNLCGSINGDVDWGIICECEKYRLNREKIQIALAENQYESYQKVIKELRLKKEQICKICCKKNLKINMIQTNDGFECKNLCNF